MMPRFECYDLPGCRMDSPLVVDTCQQGQEHHLVVQLAGDGQPIEQQPFPIQEILYLRLLFQMHPETCPPEALLAVLSGEPLEVCREIHPGMVRPREADLVSARNLLSRARKKLRFFGVDIVPLPQRGWRLCPFPKRSGVPTGRFLRLDKEPLLVPSGTLWLDQTLHTLLWVESGALREVQQFSLNTWYFLQKFLEYYPLHTPYEALLSVQTGRSLATCQEWLAQAIEQQRLSKLLHTTRYTLLRCARTVRKFGLDYRAVTNLGYKLIPVPSGEESVEGKAWEPEPEGDEALV
jgi:biotin operon repressor